MTAPHFEGIARRIGAACIGPMILSIFRLFARKPLRQRFAATCVLLAGVSGGCEKHEETQVGFTGPVMATRPSPDGKIIMLTAMGGDGLAGFDLCAKTLNGPIRTDFALLSTDWDGERFLAIGHVRTGASRVDRAFCYWIDPKTLRHTQCVPLPSGNELRWIDDDLFGRSVYRTTGDSTDGIDPELVFQIWRRAPDTMRQIYQLEINGGKYYVGGMQKVGRDRILLHVGLSAGRPGDAAHHQLLLLDTDYPRVATQADTRVRDPSWLNVADSQQFVLVWDHVLLELRRADSLDLIGQLRWEDQWGKVYATDVSDDGTYVAFGGERLLLWDVADNCVRLLKDVHLLKEESASSENEASRPVEQGIRLDDYCLRFFPFLLSIHFLANDHQFIAVTGRGELSRWDSDRRTCLDAQTIVAEQAQ